MRVFQNGEFDGENEGNHRLVKAQSYKRIPNYFFLVRLFYLRFSYNLATKEQGKCKNTEVLFP